MATINGTNGGDSLYGTAAADIISGLNGNDTLKGFGGADASMAAPASTRCSPGTLRRALAST